MGNDRLPGPQDLALAMLRGAISSPPSFGEQLAGVFLGTSLGAMVDLDKSDAAILATCQTILTKIREAKANPSAMAALEDVARKL